MTHAYNKLVLPRIKSLYQVSYQVLAMSFYSLLISVIYTQPYFPSAMSLLVSISND